MNQEQPPREPPQPGRAIPYPVPQQPVGNSGPGWIWTVIISAVVAFLTDRFLPPTDGMPVDPPPVGVPAEPPVTLPPVLPPPVVEPDEPDVPTKPDPDDTPSTPPVELDETGRIAMYAAVALPDQCKPDLKPVAENYRRAAELMESGAMKSPEDVMHWIRVENRVDITDLASFDPFHRAIQRWMDDRFAAGKLESLTQWATEFSSIAAGLTAAAGE